MSDVFSPTAVISERRSELVSADIATIADFSAFEPAYRIESDIRIQAAAGYSTVLVHLPANRNDASPVRPDVHGCVVEGLATPVDPATQVVRARLAILRDPETILRPFLAGDALQLPRVLADRVICIAGPRRGRQAGPAEDQRLDAFVRNVFGATTLWASETEEARTELRNAGLRVLDELWRPSVIGPAVLRGQQPIRRVAPIVGVAGQGAATWWSTAAEEMKAAFALAGAGRARLLLPSLALAGGAFPEDWEVLAAEDSGLRRFLAGLDFFVFCPARGPEEEATFAIASAMAAGIPTILHPRLRRLFGDGPIYAEAEAVPGIVRRYHEDEDLYREASDFAAVASSPFGPEVHRSRLKVLVGVPARLAPTPAARTEKRVLFVSSNGVGLGHLTRQLAIARRLPKGVTPVFATMSQGFSVVRQAGFEVEYIPFLTQAGYDMALWDVWLADQLCQIIDGHRISGLVFDGVTPFAGLIEALRRRNNISAVWVRRSMWRKERTEHSLAAQKYFNLVLEPGEIAAVKDQGATRAFRDVVMPVAPIQLLDPSERLDRETAARRLGIDPQRPAVLIQLGAGANHDIVTLIDAALQTLRAHPEVQPVIAEWMISAMPLKLWPNVPRIRAFPLARYYAAFDFTISATGYNSFHEIVSNGMPAILLSNPNHAMDDQHQRAAFAEEHGAALILPDSDLVSLQLAIDTMMNERARWFLGANCARLAQPNGAAAAAAAIASTVQG